MTLIDGVKHTDVSHLPSPHLLPDLSSSSLPTCDLPLFVLSRLLLISCVIYFVASVLRQSLFRCVWLSSLLSRCHYNERKRKRICLQVKAVSPFPLTRWHVLSCVTQQAFFPACLQCLVSFFVDAYICIKRRRCIRHLSLTMNEEKKRVKVSDVFLFHSGPPQGIKDRHVQLPGEIETWRRRGDRRNP